MLQKVAEIMSHAEAGSNNTYPIKHVQTNEHVVLLLLSLLGDVTTLSE